MGNLKLDFMAKSIGIHFFGFEDIFRSYKDNENLKQPFGSMDTLNMVRPIQAIECHFGSSKFIFYMGL